MTNIEYYGLNNLIFDYPIIKEYDRGEDAVYYTSIYYKCKHADKKILLDSLQSECEDDIREDKARWLLNEHKPSNAYFSLDHSDFLRMKHVKNRKEKLYQDDNSISDATFERVMKDLKEAITSWDF